MGTQSPGPRAGAERAQETKPSGQGSVSILPTTLKQAE